MVINRDLISIRDAQRREERSSTVFYVVVIALCAFILFTRLFWLYCVQVEGDSMNDTLQTGDYLVVDRLVKMDYGDVIVFELKGKNYIKRVIAFGGDTVKIEDGRVFVKREGQAQFNEVKYSEKGETKPSVFPAVGANEYLVPKDCVYVLGDNRENSTDSRVLNAIPCESVSGVVRQSVIDNRNGFWGRFYRYV